MGMPNAPWPRSTSGRSIGEHEYAKKRATYMLPFGGAGKLGRCNLLKRLVAGARNHLDLHLSQLLFRH